MVLLGAFSPSLSSTSAANILPLSVVLIACIALIDLGIPKRLNPFGIMFLTFLTFVLLHGFFGTLNERAIIVSLSRFFVLASLAFAFHRLGMILHPGVLLDVGAYLVSVNIVLFVLTSLSRDFSLLAFFLYYNNADNLDFLGYFDTRFSGTFGNPNTLGIVFAYFIPLFITFTKGRKSMAVIAGALFLIAVSLSRTAFILLALTFLLIVFTGNFRSRRIARVLLFAIVISILLVFGNVFELSIVQRASNLNLGGREELWANGLASLNDRNFIFGVGDLNSGLTIIDNEYLSILIQFGIFGLALFLITLALYFYSGVLLFAYQRRKLGFALTSTALLIVVSSLVASPLTSLKLSFFLVLLPSFLLGSVHRFEAPAPFETGPKLRATAD